MTLKLVDGFISRWWDGIICSFFSFFSENNPYCLKHTYYVFEHKSYAVPSRALENEGSERKRTSLSVSLPNIDLLTDLLIYRRARTHGYLVPLWKITSSSWLLIWFIFVCLMKWNLHHLWQVRFVLIFHHFQISIFWPYLTFYRLFPNSYKGLVNSIHTYMCTLAHFRLNWL